MCTQVVNIYPQAVNIKNTTMKVNVESMPKLTQNTKSKMIAFSLKRTAIADNFCSFEFWRTAIFFYFHCFLFNFLCYLCAINP